MKTEDTGNQNQILTVDETAKLLKCSAITVRKWVRNGILKCRRIGIGGRTIRILKEDIIRMIEGKR